ncbi:MAG: hypothetical protein JSS76_14705 [Bacteroidetes bacterium]|nr:hypothetical protein [Bacteroidota bacterium]
MKINLKELVQDLSHEETFELFQKLDLIWEEKFQNQYDFEKDSSHIGWKESNSQVNAAREKFKKLREDYWWEKVALSKRVSFEYRLFSDYLEDSNFEYFWGVLNEMISSRKEFKLSSTDKKNLEEIIESNLRINIQADIKQSYWGSKAKLFCAYILFQSSKTDSNSEEEMKNYFEIKEMTKDLPVNGFYVKSQRCEVCHESPCQCCYVG